MNITFSIYTYALDRRHTNCGCHGDPGKGRRFYFTSGVAIHRKDESSTDFTRKVVHAWSETMELAKVRWPGITFEFSYHSGPTMTGSTFFRCKKCKGLKNREPRNHRDRTVPSNDGSRRGHQIWSQLPWLRILIMKQNPSNDHYCSPEHGIRTMYYNCMKCRAISRKVTSHERHRGPVPRISVRNGIIVTDPDYPQNDHYCHPEGMLYSSLFLFSLYFSQTSTDSIIGGTNPLASSPTTTPATSPTTTPPITESVQLLLRLNPQRLRLTGPSSSGGGSHILLRKRVGKKRVISNEYQWFIQRETSSPSTAAVMGPSSSTSRTTALMSNERWWMFLFYPPITI